MKKVFFSKTKPAKIFVLIIRVSLIIFTFMAFMMLQEYRRSIEQEKGALSYLEEVYEYVKENEAVFQKVAEYQFSLLGDGEEAIIERYGDMQAERNIIFRYFHTGGVCSDGGKLHASFDCYYDSSYVIMLLMVNDIGKSTMENERRKSINDDMCILLIRERY